MQKGTDEYLMATGTGGPGGSGVTLNADVDFDAAMRSFEEFTSHGFNVPVSIDCEALKKSLENCVGNLNINLGKGNLGIDSENIGNNLLRKISGIKDKIKGEIGDADIQGEFSKIFDVPDLSAKKLGDFFRKSNGDMQKFYKEWAAYAEKQGSHEASGTIKKFESGPDEFKDVGRNLFEQSSEALMKAAKIGKSYFEELPEGLQEAIAEARDSLEGFPDLEELLNTKGFSRGLTDTFEKAYKETKTIEQAAKKALIQKASRLELSGDTKQAEKARRMAGEIGTGTEQNDTKALIDIFKKLANSVKGSQQTWSSSLSDSVGNFSKTLGEGSSQAVSLFFGPFEKMIPTILGTIDSFSKLGNAIAQNKKAQAENDPKIKAELELSAAKQFSSALFSLSTRLLGAALAITESGKKRIKADMALDMSSGRYIDTIIKSTGSSDQMAESLTLTTDSQKKLAVAAFDTAHKVGLTMEQFDSWTDAFQKFRALDEFGGKLDRTTAEASKKFVLLGRTQGLSAEQTANLTAKFGVMTGKTGNISQSFANLAGSSSYLKMNSTELADAMGPLMDSVEGTGRDIGSMMPMYAAQMDALMGLKYSSRNAAKALNELQGAGKSATSSQIASVLAMNALSPAMKKAIARAATGKADATVKDFDKLNYFTQMRGVRAGAAGHLGKEFNPLELQQTMEKHFLRMSGGNAGLAAELMGKFTENIFGNKDLGEKAMDKLALPFLQLPDKPVDMNKGITDIEKRSGEYKTKLDKETTEGGPIQDALRKTISAQDRMSDSADMAARNMTDLGSLKVSEGLSDLHQTALMTASSLLDMSTLLGASAIISLISGIASLSLAIGPLTGKEGALAKLGDSLTGSLPSVSKFAAGLAAGAANVAINYGGSEVAKKLGGTGIESGVAQGAAGLGAIIGGGLGGPVGIAIAGVVTATAAAGGAALGNLSSNIEGIYDKSTGVGANEEVKRRVATKRAAMSESEAAKLTNPAITPEMLFNRPGRKTEETKPIDTETEKAKKNAQAAATTPAIPPTTPTTPPPILATPAIPPTTPPTAPKIDISTLSIRERISYGLKEVSEHRKVLERNSKEREKQRTEMENARKIAAAEIAAATATPAIPPIAPTTSPAITPILATPAIPPIAPTTSPAITPILATPAIPPTAPTTSPAITPILATPAIPPTAPTTPPTIPPILATPAIPPTAPTTPPTAPAEIATTTKLETKDLKSSSFDTSVKKLTTSIDVNTLQIRKLAAIMLGTLSMGTQTISSFKNMSNGLTKKPTIDFDNFFTKKSPEEKSMDIGDVSKIALTGISPAIGLIETISGKLGEWSADKPIESSNRQFSNRQSMKPLDISDFLATMGITPALGLIETISSKLGELSAYKPVEMKIDAMKIRSPDIKEQNQSKIIDKMTDRMMSAKIEMKNDDMKTRSPDIKEQNQSKIIDRMMDRMMLMKMKDVSNKYGIKEVDEDSLGFSSAIKSIAQTSRDLGMAANISKPGKFLEATPLSGTTGKQPIFLNFQPQIKIETSTLTPEAITEKVFRHIAPALREVIAKVISARENERNSTSRTPNGG